ncbi:hypothetical protein BDR05DRAFT_1060209 [Suillus weaverae]|nr:hypothetical protein BDR05DRAFT_1060209 [Suillus weaverae]
MRSSILCMAGSRSSSTKEGSRLNCESTSRLNGSMVTEPAAYCMPEFKPCPPARGTTCAESGIEHDRHADDVQPTSIWCRGWQKAISLDKRFRYYPGLWDKHRGKCPGILKIERDKN